LPEKRTNKFRKYRPLGQSRQGNRGGRSGAAKHLGKGQGRRGELEDKRYDPIISGAISPDEGYTSVPLFRDQLVRIMRRDHPLAACSFVRLDGFPGNILISRAEKSRNRFYQQILKAQYIEPKSRS
jgi:DNA-binding transcriptional LysR family regulator